MTILTNLLIENSYGDLLTTTNGGGGLTTQLQPVQDGLGNSSPLQLATHQINIDRSNGNTFQLDGEDVIATADNINSVAQDNPILPGTGAVLLPYGTTAQRPVPAINGMLRYNTERNQMEVYTNNAWH